MYDAEFMLFYIFLITYEVLLFYYYYAVVYTIIIIIIMLSHQTDPILDM